MQVVTALVASAGSARSSRERAPVTDDVLPVLWPCGPAGVGKSTVSWQLFTELERAGAHIAFADTDQLCMCYPAPPSDPRRGRLKARTLDAMIVNYRAAGVRCLIVNGVTDPVLGVYRDVLSQAALTVCRMRADRDELARRFSKRHGPSDDLKDAPCRDWPGRERRGIQHLSRGVARGDHHVVPASRRARRTNAEDHVPRGWR
jgi:hypothetical protein